jgi:hypothetical protein
LVFIGKQRKAPFYIFFREPKIEEFSEYKVRSYSKAREGEREEKVESPQFVKESFKLKRIVASRQYSERKLLRKLIQLISVKEYSFDGQLQAYLMQEKTVREFIEDFIEKEKLK